MASSSSTTNKPVPQDPHNHHPLKCPRCDSSNTKFCYYNNYSLSQPRHFCKACKRYWTRGGTLRNVPVGGGCRRNKRPKRHPSSAAATIDTATVQSQLNSSQNTLCYGLTTNPLEINFPFSSFRVSSDVSGLDLHPQSNGLGFPSGGLIHDPASNSTSPPFSSSGNSSIFFGSSSLMPYQDLQMVGNEVGKQVKAGGNRLGWNPSPSQTPNPMNQINSSDTSSLLWNTTSIGAWFDPSSSSVPSLI